MLWYDVSTLECVGLVVSGIVIYIFGLVVGVWLAGMPKHERRGRRAPHNVEGLGFDPSNPINRNAEVNRVAVERQNSDGWYLRDWRDVQ